MKYAVVILKSAEQDLRDLKRYLVKDFGKAVWQDLPFTHKYLYPEPTAPSSNPAHNICR